MKQPIKVLVTPEQYERLAAAAQRQGNSLAAVVRLAVEEYLRRQEKAVKS
jgi:predicted DNA-binding protein